jgi:hypothetical protein
MATATDDDTLESLATIVRRMVGRELREMDKKLFLSDEDVDKLSKLALTMQRMRVPATSGGVAIDPENPAAAATNETLMKKAANE